jgi:hypothetical protein
MQPKQGMTTPFCHAVSNVLACQEGAIIVWPGRCPLCALAHVLFVLKLYKGLELVVLCSCSYVG